MKRDVNSSGRKASDINAVLQAVVFYTLAIPFSGRAGAECKSKNSDRGEAKQKFFHTLIKSWFTNYVRVIQRNWRVKL